MHSEHLSSPFLNNALGQAVPRGRRAWRDGHPCADAGGGAPRADHVSPWRSVYKIHLQTPTRMSPSFWRRADTNAGIVSTEPGRSRRSYQIAATEDGTKDGPWTNGKKRPVRARGFLVGGQDAKAQGATAARRGAAPIDPAQACDARRETSWCAAPTEGLLANEQVAVHYRAATMGFAPRRYICGGISPGMPVMPVKKGGGPQAASGGRDPSLNLARWPGNWRLAKRLFPAPQHCTHTLNNSSQPGFTKARSARPTSAPLETRHQLRATRCRTGGVPPQRQGAPLSSRRDRAAGRGSGGCNVEEDESSAQQQAPRSAWGSSTVIHSIAWR